MNTKKNKQDTTRARIHGRLYQSSTELSQLSAHFEFHLQNAKRPIVVIASQDSWSLSGSLFCVSEARLILDHRKSLFFSDVCRCLAAARCFCAARELYSSPTVWAPLLTALRGNLQFPVTGTPLRWEHSFPTPSSFSIRNPDPFRRTSFNPFKL